MAGHNPPEDGRCNEGGIHPEMRGSNEGSMFDVPSIRSNHRLASRSFWLVVGIETIATALVALPALGLTAVITGGQWVYVTGAVLGVWFGRDGYLKGKEIDP